MRFGFERMPSVERMEAMMGAVVPRPRLAGHQPGRQERLNAAP
jgi:hypothetical protein